MSYIHSAAAVGAGSVLSYVDIHDEVVPENVVLHGLKQTNGKFVCRIFGTHDNPKSNTLFGKPIPEEFGKTLWSAPLYPEKETIRDAEAAALKLHDNVMRDDWSNIERGKSLTAGFKDADPEAILAWNKHMQELVAMNRLSMLIDNHEPVTLAHLSAPLAMIQTEWMNRRVKDADYGTRMRLHYYVGTAMGGVDGEKEVSYAFGSLSSAILASKLEDLTENTEARINRDSVEVELTLRVNWGGDGFLRWC